MEQSTTIGHLASALAAAQGEMKPAAKDAENPHFKSKYADLASVWEACRAPLAKHKLAVIQTVAAQGDVVAITTMLVHGETGEWVRDVLHLLPRDPSPQSAGSAITYGRRYALSAIVGVAPDDDDGNAASGPPSGGRRYENADRQYGGARGNAPAPAQPGASATSASPTAKPSAATTTSKPSATASSAAEKAPDAPPPADDEVKAAAKGLCTELASFTSKEFATLVWESTKDWTKRRDLLLKARNAAATVIDVLGEGRGGELLTDLIRRDEPVAMRVANLVAASLGETVPPADKPPF